MVAVGFLSFLYLPDVQFCFDTGVRHILLYNLGELIHSLHSITTLSYRPLKGKILEKGTALHWNDDAVGRIIWYSN
jgi:hypothetical protein